MASKLKNLVQSAWDSEKKQLFGRDGLGWAKMFAFYSGFYAMLAGVFLSMTLIVMALTPTDRPKYILGESTMAVITPLNPGLGFRPQLNHRDELIGIDLRPEKENYQEHVDSLETFLAEYKNGTTQIDCDENMSPPSQASCKFDLYTEECSSQNHYGYKEGCPCVLIKLNRIYGWTSGGTAKIPTEDDISDGKGSMPPGGPIRIKCMGEHAGDKDRIHSIKYFSLYGESNECGDIPNSVNYFPFRSQKDYLSPYVWAKFNVSKNSLVSVICRAYADNIDSTCKLRMRGMVRFKIMSFTR